ncbi:MAG: hypothetical protein F6J87_24675 [Spirulina sp. SIO3F2]|nr:hypothetical protein [Spirulina sp. SIO3F2]
MSVLTQVIENPQWQPDQQAIAQPLHHHQQQIVAQLYLDCFQQQHCG